MVKLICSFVGTAGVGVSHSKRVVPWCGWALIGACECRSLAPSLRRLGCQDMLHAMCQPANTLVDGHSCDNSFFLG
eukprot:3854485-Amphidinium_carterae.1